MAHDGTHGPLIRQAKAEALREMASEFRDRATLAGGSDAAWLTSGTKMADIAAQWCDESAAQLEAKP